VCVCVYIFAAAHNGILFTIVFQGITYSLMSASWDEDREGSFLGVDEFNRNIQNIKDGLGRSRENAIIRDRMAGLGEDEIQRALTDLEKREMAETKRKQSFDSKIKDQLD
jgi:hypothetical protein